MVDVFVDAELGREAFTYSLASGRCGSVHVDAVLEYNRDPAHMAEVTLYRLSARAAGGVPICVLFAAENPLDECREAHGECGTEVPR